MSELLDEMVKAQNAVAEASWDIVRVQDTVKEADAHLAQCRTNLSDAHVRHAAAISARKKAAEAWLLSVIESHRPTSYESIKPGVK